MFYNKYTEGQGAWKGRFDSCHSVVYNRRGIFMKGLNNNEPSACFAASAGPA